MLFASGYANGLESDLPVMASVIRTQSLAHLARRAALGRRPHTVIRSKTDVEAPGATVAITPAAMQALSAIRPAEVAGDEKVFGLSESQIARRVKAIARAAGLENWEFFSGHSGRVGMARRMAQNGAPTHEIERQGRWKQGGGMVGRYTRGAAVLIVPVYRTTNHSVGQLQFAVGISELVPGQAAAILLRFQPALQRPRPLSRPPSGQQSFHSDVLVQIGPMEVLPTGVYLPVVPLLRSCVH